MSITGAGNTHSLSMSGNTGQQQNYTLGQVAVKPVAPTNYTNLIDSYTIQRICVARRELNAANENPGLFGGIQILEGIGATIAIRPSGGSFPSVKAYGNSRVYTSPQTTHQAILPRGIEAGMLLLAFIVIDNNATINTPEGWTELFDVTSDNDTRLKCVHKVAAGNEGNSVSFITNLNRNGAHITLSITDFQGTPEAATDTVNADPPNLTPSWGALNTLWLAIQCGKPSTDQAINNGPQGSIYGYYEWVNEEVIENGFPYAQPNISPYKDKNYYTSASSPNALVFPNTNISINDFYFTSPLDEWSL